MDYRMSVSSTDDCKWALNFSAVMLWRCAVEDLRLQLLLSGQQTEPAALGSMGKSVPNNY